MREVRWASQAMKVEKVGQIEHERGEKGPSLSEFRASFGLGAAAAEHGSSGSSSATASRGVLKPDIVFFKEALPGDFFASLRSDLESVDLLLVIGTSLRVAPVSDIVGKIDSKVPAILINREVCVHASVCTCVCVDGGVTLCVCVCVRWLGNPTNSTCSCWVTAT